MRLTIVLLLLSATAAAQSFPPERKWRPLRCGQTLMTDPTADVADARFERDLVGNDPLVAGQVWADRDFVYLRMRLDADPYVDDDVPGAHAWGVLLDLDGDLTRYEVLVEVNGVDERVALYRNTTVTLPNSPADPPDLPAVRTYALETHARRVAAVESSTFGNSPDSHLEVAIPWSDLADLGVLHASRVRVWLATSSDATALDGDLSCGGGGGLSSSAGAETVIDPVLDSDGDGYSDATEIDAGTDPDSPSSVPTGPPDAAALAGGGGCNAAGAGGAWVLLFPVWLAVARRRRPARSMPNGSKRVAEHPFRSTRRFRVRRAAAPPRFRRCRRGRDRAPRATPSARSPCHRRA